MSDEVLIDVCCTQCGVWNEGLADPGWRQGNCKECGRELHVSDETRRHEAVSESRAEDVDTRPTASEDSQGRLSDADDDKIMVAPKSKQRKYQVRLEAPNGAITKIDPALILTRQTEMSSNALTFVIDEAVVSRKHLWIGCACNDLIFVDLGSTNGTTVNGFSLSPFVPHAKPYRKERIRVQLGQGYHFHIEVEPV